MLMTMQWWLLGRPQSPWTKEDSNEDDNDDNDAGVNDANDIMTMNQGR